jgi:hypothetical protein
METLGTYVLTVAGLRAVSQNIQKRVKSKVSKRAHVFALRPIKMSNDS